MPLKAYVLHCEGDYFFVGLTDNINNAWYYHINGLIYIWTQIHKPLQIVTVIDNAETHDEFSLIKMYMAKFGIHKVRGGNYMSLTLSPMQLDFLKTAIDQELAKDQEIDEIADLCNTMNLR